MSDDDPGAHAVEITVTNDVNSREGMARINPEWKMLKVREVAYRVTRDSPRPTDRFTCANENNVISGAQLEETFAELTRPSGFCPGNHHFFIRGPSGGA